MFTEYSAQEQYRWHHLDPRTLLLAAACAAFCFSCVRSLQASLACLAFALLLAVFRGLRAVPLLKRLAGVNVFIAFIWLTVPFTMPGERIAGIGPLAWSREGVHLALLVTLKCNAILISFLALVGGISLPRIGCALERLRVPPKLVFVFLFTWRYIHVVGEEWHRLLTAAKLRGFVPRNSLHTYRTIGNLLGLTLINALDRSRRIYEAMLTRGFAGKFHTVADLGGTHSDIGFLLLFSLIPCGLLFLDLCLE